MRPGVVLVAVALAVAQFDRREQGMKRRIMELSRWRQKQKFKLEMGGDECVAVDQDHAQYTHDRKSYGRGKLWISLRFERIEIL
jgi:hypothetical protein